MAHAGFCFTHLVGPSGATCATDPPVSAAAASTLSRYAPESESSLRHVFWSPLPRRRMHPFGQGRQAPRISTRAAIGRSDQARSRPRPIGSTLLMQETCSKMLTRIGVGKARNMVRQGARNAQES